ncbi:MAG: amidohydrolase family protein, partial [Acidobacteriota bacterium]
MKIKKKYRLLFYFLFSILFFASFVFNKTHLKTEGTLHHGMGPFKQLIIRGVTLIDGTGGPPIGPYDVVIEGNRIAEVRRLGYPGVKIPDEIRPKNAEYEIDAHGMFMLPGLISTHTHLGVPALDIPVEYIYKLMLGHGVTTIREPGSNNGIDWTLKERDRSTKNEIVAPRIFVYIRAKKWNSVNPLKTPEKAREWVREVAKKGIDGLKLGAHDPDIMAALIDEAKKHGLGTMAHLDRHGLMRMNTLDAARLGLGTAVHVLGLFESLFEKRTIPDLPPDYRPNIYNTRLYETGRLWRQAAKQGSKKWNDVMTELLQSGIVLEPTFVPYNICRDVSKAHNAVWHEEYTLPVLLDFWKPSPSSHFTFYSD